MPPSLSMAKALLNLSCSMMLLTMELLAWNCRFLTTIRHRKKSLRT